MDAEQLRGSLAVSGDGLWAASAGQSSQLLCTWNAFALQTLGDELVEADYQADPRTAGFLPPVTAEQPAAQFRDDVTAGPPAGGGSRGAPGQGGLRESRC